MLHTTIDDLRNGESDVDLGTTEWQTIDQARINEFAEATGDRQWIHLDIDRAASGPYGATIAHGYLTLSLVPCFGLQAYRLDGWRMAVNYGLNKVRFITPVRVDSRVRGVMELVALEELA